jgi:hypothetical protein
MFTFSLESNYPLFTIDVLKRKKADPKSNSSQISFFIYGSLDARTRFVSASLMASVSGSITTP